VNFGQILPPIENNNSHEKEVKWAKIETFLYENLLLEKQNDGYVL
jgi:hypothetical protein